MAFGVGAPGLSPERHDGEVWFKTLEEYRDRIREITRSELVDIMLMSASTCEALAIGEKLFDNSPVTAAARANDTTDIHILRGGRIHEAPSHPFRTASLDHIQCGRAECVAEEKGRGANLGLYSITFNNDPERDRLAIEHYKAFREEAERKDFRHFLEVFDPNMPNAVAPDQLGGFINDAITRTLAGVTTSQRPLFLKIAYHGPKAMEELVRFDPHLVVGILGGSSGTTRDAFQLLYDAKKYGARVALFGRKINNSECQLAFVHFLRLIADGHLEPEESVRAYHATLQRLKIPPHRPLEKDLEQTAGIMSYGGSTTTNSPSSSSSAKQKGSDLHQHPVAQQGTASPDFGKMSAAERLAYHRDRLNRRFGES